MAMVPSVVNRPRRPDSDSDFKILQPEQQTVVGWLTQARPPIIKCKEDGPGEVERDVNEQQLTAP
jgi:hypothetical protein